MGVSLFKDGAWSVFHEDTFSDRLNEGWSLSDQMDDTEIILDNTLPKGSTLGYGIGSGPDAAEWLAYDKRMSPGKVPVKRKTKLSNKQVRAAAKKAGIVGHAKARIKGLRKALSL